MVLQELNAQDVQTGVSRDAEFAALELILRNYLPPEEIERIRQAYHFAAEAHKIQKRSDGEPYITHPLAVACILAEYQSEPDTIIAGLLHDVVEDTPITHTDLQTRFGTRIAELVQGVTKVSALASTYLHPEVEVENVRSMLIATAKDIHVVIIKLADRLHNMRTLKALPQEKQIRIAKNTEDIFAPIAHRLGLGQIKSELEDLALSCREPEMYQLIKRKVAQKRQEREQYVRASCQHLSEALLKQDIQCSVEGRAKHFYSIYQKMIQDNKSFEEIYDLVAIRVICETIGDCYAILGEVHTMWRQVEGRFKDYISTPKANNYRSIHTTVMGPHGRLIEIQIRTLEMHLDAEYGIAAHWYYKEGKSNRAKHDSKWLRQFIRELPDTYDPEEFIQSIRNDIFSNEVYVYTPKGEIIRLQKDSTPIDLAYRIHTSLGNRCGGAKVNNKLVPLNYKLKTGDVVEILANPNNHPSPAWINIVKTSSARNKIRRYLLEDRRSELLTLGQGTLTKELQKAGHKPLEFYNSDKAKEIVASLNLKDLDDLFVNIGFGRVSPKQVIARLLAPKPKPVKPTVEEIQEQKKVEQVKKSVVRLGEIDDILYRRALCCNPLPGDDIVGFVTRGRGVSIHKAACRNLAAFEKDPGRLMPLFWESEQQGYISVTIEIIARDRHGLLRDISQMISVTGTNIVKWDTRTEKENAAMTITMDISSVSHLDTVMQQLLGIQGVRNVKKLRATPAKKGKQP